MSDALRKREDRISHHFDMAAAYRQHAHIQKQAANRLIEKIENALNGNAPNTILELGCGDGLLTELLHQKWPQASILAGDFSPKMLKRAQENIKSENVTFRIINLNAPPSLPHFDLICSNLAFQWSYDEQKAIHQWLDYVRPGGYLALSTLLDGTFREWQQAVFACCRQFSVPDYPSLKNVKAWDCYPAQMQWHEIIAQQFFENGWQFLKLLKVTGTNIPRKGYRSMTRGQLREAVRYFTAYYDSVISWHLGLGIFRRPPGEGVFVTGTDTEIGKTFACASMTRAWSGHYWKILQTGLAEEAGDLPSVLSLTKTTAYSPCFRQFKAPLSPEDAARQQDEEIDLSSLRLPKTKRGQPLIVEGAGGVMVPITPTMLMIDLMKDLGLPVVVVARSDVLGMINHTLLTIDALRQRHIPIAGIIFNGKTNEGNERQIKEKGQVRILARLPYCKRVTPETMAKISQRLPRWPAVWTGDGEESSEGKEQ